MGAGVFGWAEDKSVAGAHRMKPVTYVEYIDALEQALIELAFVWPQNGRIMGDRPDRSWIDRVRKSLGLEVEDAPAAHEALRVPDVAYVVRREEERFGYISDDEPMEMIVSNTGNCSKGHAIWSLNGGPPEHIIPTSKVKAGEYLEILECQEELEQQLRFGA